MNLQKAIQKETNANQLDALKYIELLASRTATPVDSWNVTKIFSEGKKSGVLGVVTDKNEINKRFFGYADRLKADSEKLIATVGIRIRKKIDTFTKRIGKISEEESKRRIKVLNKKRKFCIQTASKFQKKAEKLVQIASKNHRTALALEKKSSALGVEIEQVIRENFWDFFSLKGSILSMVTKTDVVLTYRNLSAGLDLRVNLGRFIARINLVSNQLRVCGYKHNVSVDGHKHPHVSYDGAICWGSAGAAATEKLAKGEVADVLRLLAALLVSYSNAAPYVCLEEFAERRAARRRR